MNSQSRIQDIDIEEGSFVWNVENRQINQRDNSFRTFKWCASIFITGTMFYCIAFFYGKPKMDAYDSFYDSTCLLTNVNITSGDIGYDTLDFSFIINHNSEIFKSKINRKCGRYDTSCRTYVPTSLFDCKIVNNTGVYTFETDRGKPDGLVIFLLSLGFGSFLFLPYLFGGYLLFYQFCG